MVSRSNPGTLERTIHFYRADIGTDDSGVLLPFDPVPALSAIAGLPYSDDGNGKYMPDSDGNVLVLRTDAAFGSDTVTFGRVRRTGLPQVEQAGSITDLSIAPDSGLFEVIHVVFFPNNIIGAEYNHFAPRLSALANYLFQKSNQAIRRPVFRALLRNDASAQIDRLGDLRVMEFTVAPSYAGAVRQIDQSLGDAFAANAQVLQNPAVLQLLLKPESQGRSGFLNRMIGALKDFIGDDQVREGTHRLQVRGLCLDSGKVETLDLLRDEFITSRNIVRVNPRSRALEPSSAIQAIREAYTELRPQLEVAAGISP